MMIKHECGGNGHTVGTLVVGWNQCLCNRCGEVFYKWFTEKMLTYDNKEK